MAHIVTGRCVDCRYTDCCTVCPVDCFYEIKDPAMLVIDPVTCIDCELCVPECPINAIYPEDELPECYEGWVDLNEQLCEVGEVIVEKVDPLEGALTLEEIRVKEQAEAGLCVEEPSKCGHHGDERPSLETGKKEIREEGEDGLAGVEDFLVGDDEEL